MKQISIAILLCLCTLAGFAQGGQPLEGTQIIKYSFKTGKQVEVLFDAATARECPFKTFDSYSFSPDGSKLLIATEQTPIYRRSYTAIHYIYSLKRNEQWLHLYGIIISIL